jgi:hypothetical protein
MAQRVIVGKWRKELPWVNGAKSYSDLMAQIGIAGKWRKELSRVNGAKSYRG